MTARDDESAAKAPFEWPPPPVTTWFEPSDPPGRPVLLRLAWSQLVACVVTSIVLAIVVYLLPAAVADSAAAGWVVVVLLPLGLGAWTFGGRWWVRMFVGIFSTFVFAVVLWSILVPVADVF